MLNAARYIDAAGTETRNSEERRVSRFLPRDPAQVFYRKLLSEFDEDQLLNLECDIEYFLASGVMSPSLSGMLNAAPIAA